MWFNIDMNHKSSASIKLPDHFQQLADPCTGPAQRHELHDILLIAACAMLCGAENFSDMALFGRAQDDWLKTWLALPNGMPSHDTFNRIFGLIAPDSSSRVFARGLRACATRWPAS